MRRGRACPWLGLLAALVGANEAPRPSAPRLTYGNSPEEMVLTFSTPNSTGAGYSAAAWIRRANGTSWDWVPAERSIAPSLCSTLGPWIHLIRFRGLEPGASYVYRFGDSAWDCSWGDQPGCSKDFSLSAAPRVGDVGKRSFVVLGDMGVLWSTPAIEVLRQELHAMDFVHHNGDISYADNLLRTAPALYQDWMDAFYDNISVVAAHRPWILGVGNHEHPCNYSEFERRAAGNPHEGAGSPSPQFFSRVHGQIFLVVLSAEQGRLSEWDSEEFVWLRDQLHTARALKRAKKISWILTFVHYPSSPTGYCSYSIDYCCDGAISGDGKPCGLADQHLNSSLWARAEDLFLEFEVDIHFTAHEHVFERSEPVYRYGACRGSTRWQRQEGGSHELKEKQYLDPTCTMYVVSGSAGNVEVFPSTWLREPAWTAPSRTTSFGFLNVTIEAQEDQSTLHVTYMATGERLPGQASAYAADKFAIVHTPRGQERRLRLASELLRKWSRPEQLVI